MKQKKNASSQDEDFLKSLTVKRKKLGSFEKGTVSVFRETNPDASFITIAF